VGVATTTKIARAPHPTPLRGATLPARGRDARPCELFRRNSYGAEAVGWRSLVVWECEIKDLAALEQRLRGFLA